MTAERSNHFLPRLDPNAGETYATEYLNAINLPTVPFHKLKLKIAAPVILLRNVACMRVMQRYPSSSQQHIVECEILHVFAEEQGGEEQGLNG
jgi:PIF1-like helicase